MYLVFTQCDEQNQEIVLKTEGIKFSTKFNQEMKFYENRGKFELKLNIGDAINSIRGVKNWIIDLKTRSSPSLANQAPSQIDGTEIGWNLVPKPISWLDQVT